MKQYLARPLFIFIFNINLLLTASFLSWQMNATTNYFYPFFYEQLDIHSYIEKYAPLNQIKKKFHTVGDAEHKRVFASLVTMAHNHGIGLSGLSYYSKSGEVIDTVLTETEVEHMQEVAHIINNAVWLGLLNMALTLLLVYLCARYRFVWPSFKQVCAITGIGVAAIALIVFLIGFDKLFYQFHQLLFSQSQWIFPRNESLLILLTKSPQYFAIMGLCIFIPAIFFYLFFMYCMCRYQDNH